MASISGPSTNASPEYAITLSPQVEKPALLNAETEWNSPSHAASPQGMPWPSAKRSMSARAMASSTPAVTFSTSLATLFTSPSDSECVSACSSKRVRMRICPLINRPISVAEVIMPKPPIWNKPMITAWPAPLQ